MFFSRLFSYGDNACAYTGQDVDGQRCYRERWSREQHCASAVCFRDNRWGQFLYYQRQLWWSSIRFGRNQLVRIGCIQWNGNMSAGLSALWLAEDALRGPV